MENAMKCMKRPFFEVTFFLVSSFFCMGSQQDLNEKIQNFSEQAGYSFADETANSGITYDMEAFINGMKKYLRGEKADTILSDEASFKEFGKLQNELFELKASKNLKHAEIYLKQLQKDPDNLSLEDGLILYKVITPGTGNSTITNSTEKAFLAYKISTPDGKEVVSVPQENPQLISLNDIIPGFRKGIIGMKQDEIRKIYIHPKMAYGKVGSLMPNHGIEPNQLIIAEVRMISLL